jgi:hypothetical protein
MELKITDERGTKFVEGTPDAAFMTNVHDLDRLIEACFADHVHAALLYGVNLTPGFFDLSSGEAGTILQKLRDYRIRLAVVCFPGSIGFSSRFSELMADEQRGADFGLFESRQAACDWLQQH